MNESGMTPDSRAVLNPTHHVLFAHRHLYTSHPHCVRLSGQELLVVVSQSVRRDVVHHPLSDPCFRNMLIRSADGGQTWDGLRAAPGYEWSGVECAGLTSLDGQSVLMSQWQFRWYTPEAGAVATDEFLTSPESSAYFGSAASPGECWTRGGGTAYVHRSADGGRTWPETVAIDTAPYSGGYGIRSAARLADGQLVLPLSDVPDYKIVFVVRSTDDGRSWGAPIEAARVPGKSFEEPAVAVLPDQTLLMVMRESTADRLYSTRSVDGGMTWAPVTDTGIAGCPPHLLTLPDGRLLCTYGYRHFPFQVRAAVSADGGMTWGDQLLVIATDLGSRDMGYPSTVLLDGGCLLCVYYGQLFDGTPAILATRFELPA
jgi:BNR repeat-like domain